VTAPQLPAKPLDHKVIPRILAGIMLAMFLSALDQTIVATALATIGRAYADVENLTWVVTAYLLAATVVVPIYGKLSDIYGRRPAMLFGIAIFVAGSIACALSPTMPALIAARALQGIGGGGLIALSQTIVGDAVSPRERGRYQGYFGAVFAIASIAGPVLGGVFAEHLHWSFIFWINVPLGLAAFVISSRALKLLPRHERRHRLDLLGAALMMAATIALLLALNWGGVRYPWASPQILGLAAAAIVLFALFVLRLSTAPEPIRAARHYPAQPRGRSGDWLRVVGLWHYDRSHDLHSGLLRDGARRKRERRGADADPVHGRRGDRLDLRGPADGAADTLQAHGTDRAAARGRGVLAAGNRAGRAVDICRRRAVACRGLRPRHRAADHDGRGAERGTTVATWHRHRRNQLRARAV